jgi:hypothetical protein
MPLTADPKRPAPPRQLPRAAIDSIRAQTGAIEDEGLREALEKLGRGVLGKRGR